MRSPDPLTATDPALLDVALRRTVADLVEDQQARTPDAIAVVSEDGTLTYAELGARVRALAAHLRGLGVGPETVVGVCAVRGAAMVVGVLAVLRAGGAYLPLDPEYPTDRLSYMLTDAQVDIVLAHEPTAAEVAELGCRTTVDIDAEFSARSAPLPGAEPGNLAYLIYTSGSTGRPKGAALAHAGVVNRLLWMQRTYPIGQADAVLQKTPFSFDVSVWELFWPLITGARLVLARPGGHRDPAHLAALIREHRITIVHFVPSMLAQFLREPTIGEITTLRHVVCSGEALPPDVARRAVELLPGTVENLYGPTEASVDVSYHRCDPATDTTTVPIGLPVANTALHVLTDELRPAPDGVPGELYLGGIQLARGYHRRPGLTASRFVPDPFGSGGRLYRTGDIAVRRPDGEVEYLGRTDHQVKINGFRVELDEIAVALRTHPAVHDAVVIAHTGAAGNQRLVGYLVIERGRRCPSPAGVREFLGRTLPAHMIPPLYQEIDEIPLSPNGKIDRKLLPEPEARQVDPDIAGSTAAEQALLEVWRGVLGGVGPDDDFLDLGGDSIVALTLVTRARAAGLLISAEHILRHRTIRAIAELADVVPAAGEAAARPVAEPGRDAAELAAIAALDDVAEVYPLTPLQAGMLFHSEYQDGATDYFEQSVMRVSGPFDPDLFAQAWRDVASRHPALRSRVAWAGLSRPVQVVERTVRTPITVVDPDEHDPDEHDLDRVAARDRALGFDPAAAPPLRLSLVRLADLTWAVVLSHHHLLLDGWSMSMVIRELVRAYRARLVGEPVDTSAGPPFRRYVDWLDQQDTERAAAFWRDRLSGWTGRTPLPHARDQHGQEQHSQEQRAQQQRTQQQHAQEREAAADRIGELAVTFSGPRAVALRERARAEGLTLNSIVRGLWGLLLARYGDRDDVVFGSTYSGRPPELPEVDTTIGLFINTLPVRLRVRGGAALGEWLREVQWDLLELQEHQHCSLPDIRAWSGAPAGQALFDTIVVGQNQPAAEAHDPDTGLRISSHDAVIDAGYPLVLRVVEHGADVELVLRYQHARFDEAAVRRVGGHLDAVLTAFVTDPAQLVDDVDLVTAREFGSWPVFGAEVPEPVAGATVHGLIEATARRVPDAVAVRGGDQELTFAELNTRANRLANHLRERGVGAETLVGVCAHRTPELLVSLLGVLKAGGAYLPLAPDNPAERLGAIIADAGLGYVVVDDDLRELVAGAADADLIAPGSGTDGSDPTPLSTPDNIAYVIYTSGSSGTPKGVAVAHRGVVNHLRWCLAQLPEGAVGGAPVLSSFGFDLIVPSLYAPLVAGQPVRLLPDGLDAGELADRVADGAPYSFIKLTPGLLELLAENLTPERAAGLARVLLVGGEAFPEQVRARWRRLAPDTVIINHYGPTEVSVGCSSWRTGAEPGGGTLVPIGRPHQNQSTYLLDDRLRRVPVGVPGEICVGGVGNARGYLNRPGLTAERFVPDPFSTVPGARMYLTGDRAVRLPGGELYFLGRRDGQVKIRGYRVELGEIERALSGHPDLRRAVVAAPTDDSGRQRLVAYVVPAERGAVPTAALLRSWLGDRLPPYLVPATYLVLDEIPLTANGKVDRAALAGSGAVEPAVEREYVAPRGDTERAIAESWARVLRVERVGAHDNFFELGGDSIMTLQIVAGARRAGLRITPKLIFQYPTIARLAPHAVPITAQAPPRPVAATDEWFPLAPIQRVFAERDLPDHNHYNQSVVLSLEAADPVRLAAALRTVVAHCPALRTRFDLGGRRQRVVAAEDADLLWYRDLADSRGAALTEAVAAVADSVQSSLDIVVGPVVRAGLVRTGDGPDRVLLAVHHLVVDTLSWRSLVEDLAAAYEGRPLTPTTSSYRDWVASLGAAAVDGAAQPGAPMALPVDHDHGPDTVATAATVRAQLSEQDTLRLLRDAPMAHRVQVEDIVLTAAARTLVEWTGGAVTVDVERHGRDSAPDELDISRTVGWFTQVFPVRVERPDLHLVKDQLRALPAVGNTGPVAPVVVNYHGRVDRSVPDVGPFAVSTVPLGAEKGSAYPRPRPIEVEAAVRDGVLHVEWTYPTTRLRQDTVEHLAEAFLTHLRELTAYCVEHPGGYTPSDFPLVGLTQAEVDRIAAGGADIEDIHPLTAIQQGMLFHSLLDPDDDMYLGRRTYRLDGRIDVAAFTEAWREVGRRHPILRGTVVWDGVDQPVQVVRAQDDLRVVDQVRPGGFDLTAAPPIEVALLPEGDGLRVVLSYHHIIIDGWSVSTVVTEVVEIYHALLAGSTDRPDPAPSFRQYVAWLAAADQQRERAYWSANLGDLAHTTPLPIKPPQVPGTSSATVDVDLSPSLHDAVRGFLADAGLTLATAAQGAWATVLADRAGSDDVVFGATVAIRPGELPDVGRMVGPLINTLPVRVRVEPTADPRDWLSDLQGHHAEVREHAASALTDIHRLTSLPAGESLFDTILVVENFPRPVIAGAEASLTAVLEFERTGYPVVIGVIDADPIRVQVLYEQADCDPEFARDLAEDLVRAFARLCRPA
ncbi:non-ribosomal peptide synthetase [Actinokineospora diospyrosa]|nr:non-ribosomal peptide synthetase [Actinokineospora diospyrosa]